MKVTLLRQEMEQILVEYVMEKLNKSCGSPTPVYGSDCELEGYEIEVHTDVD